MSKANTENKWRSLVKSISWRIVAFVVLGTISYLFTGNWEETGLITLVYTFVQIFVYFLHERVWATIDWGKTAPIELLPHAEDISAKEVAVIQSHLKQLGYIE